ncbi:MULTISPECIES: CoA transferase [Pseudomonas]|uniref:Crotonobetainyl-CoA:carnitine CoA-transferase CaiB-like acyl-CoA transferase n=1 Tax=Pseudomonas hunanensis TaxID=1247546 RepID=A0ACC6K0T4_9PSED|nr:MULTISPECIES: CoA transferase [Pseudomonas]MBP2260197.1 crotonobetainyl-CoA:carnitine CoA-transferase CaiB-like acyl-CoA transferase [Pseudomonas sp. BP8]MDR6712048.1 crotonobetainyl-CoA:carnitine CoA-transferase CaiB-like acyl-CoA transferase [Pseudomonas hunanensis]HDS1737547.1 CoA transferase [Pseudomonas putida]
MSRILHEGGLAWRSGPCLPAWQSLSAALARQGECLGLRHKDSQAGPDSPALQLLHPDLRPLQTRLVGLPGLPLELSTEFTLQAACGLMSVHGRASGRPQALGVNYLATLNAALAWQGSLAAAVGQLRGGRFANVELAPAGGALLSIGQYLAGATAPEDPEQLLPGQDDALARPPFISADGVLFELETLDSQPWRRFWSTLEVSDTVAGKAWQQFLLRYARAVAPMPAECLDAVARLPLARIQALAQDCGVALVPVRSPQQRRADADHAASAAAPWQMRHGPAATPRVRKAPGKLPLEGIRVLESCRRIQGPLAGHLLSLLGAEVIRLEPPGGDPLRNMPPCAEGCSVRFDALNHLKRVREVDIKSAQGRAEIHALCAEADVFLHNWAPGKAAELALDAVDLHAAQPSLIHAYAGGWGDAQVDAPGTDFTVQAWSGVASRIASASGTRGGTLFTALDVLGGVISAQGICAALLERELHGHGSQVHSSLLGAADLLLDPHSGALSPSLLQGVFATGDDLLAIDCQTRQQHQALARLLGGEADPRRLHEQLRGAGSEHWLNACLQAGIPASVVHEDLALLATDPRLAPSLTQRAYRSVQSPWSFT